VQVSSQIIHADRSSLFVYDERTDELWSMVAEGIESRQIRVPSTSGLAGDSFTRQAPINVADAYTDPRFNQSVDQDTGYHTHGVLTVPVTTRDGRRLGVMQAFNRLDGEPFDETDVARLTAFGAQAAVAIENATLFAEVASERNYNESILRSMSSGGGDAGPRPAARQAERRGLHDPGGRAGSRRGPGHPGEAGGEQPLAGAGNPGGGRERASQEPARTPISRPCAARSFPPTSRSSR